MARLFSVSDEFHLLCIKVGIINTPHGIDAFIPHLCVALFCAQELCVDVVLAIDFYINSDRMM